jgi:hypothetical protein
MSKLRVNDVIPANGLDIGIGTAGGNLIVGGASTTVVVNGDINITGNVTGSSGATFTNITVGANNGFHVDGGAPASSLTVNNLGNTVVGSGHSVYVGNGNLVFQTTGTGIDFSGVGINSTSATSSILDDYEEGSWTPSDYSGGRSFGANTWGFYVKVGRYVHASCYIDCANSHSTNASEVFTVTGLPFVPLDPGSGGFVGTPMFRQIDVESTTVNVAAYTTDTTNGIRFYKCRDADDWDPFINSEVLSTSDFYVNITYFTS